MRETRFNRQLRPDETAKLKRLQEDKSPEEQQRLADAACALTHCSTGVPDSDPAKVALVASEQRGQQYTAEQNQLQSGGLFTYTGSDRFNDAADRYQFTNRAVGAVQGVSAAAAAAAAIGSGCSTIVACGLGATVAGTSLDYSKAGFEQLVNGNLTPTYGEQVLRSLGLSPDAAALAYGVLNLGGRPVAPH